MRQCVVGDEDIRLEQSGMGMGTVRGNWVSCPPCLSGGHGGPRGCHRCGLENLSESEELSKSDG